METSSNIEEVFFGKFSLLSSNIAAALAEANATQEKPLSIPMFKYKQLREANKKAS